jgi:hypothetical protein
VRKQGFCQPVANHDDEETSKYFYKDLPQVVLSAKQKRKKKKNNENLTFRSLPDNDRTDNQIVCGFDSGRRNNHIFYKIISYLK